MLPPIDQAALRPDFLRFRQELREIARRHDEAALMRVVNPSIKMSFGDGNGLDEFRSLVRNADQDPDADFWRDFARVLDLGGTFFDVGLNTFVAPYIYSQWPNEYDVFDCVAVIGRNVRLRDRPRSDGRVIDTLSYAIVARDLGASEGPWTEIETARGQHGYIATRYLYSPVDYRAFFSYRDGRWMMDVFIGGD